MIKEKKEYIIAGVISVVMLGISAFCIYSSNKLAKDNNEPKDKITQKSIILANDKESVPANGLAINNKEISTQASDSKNSQSETTTKPENVTKPEIPKQPETSVSQEQVNPPTPPTPPPPVIPDFKPVTIDYKEYLVKQGDTLSKIWRENIVCIPYSKARDMICHENQLANVEDLNPGQSLKIPVVQYEGYDKCKVNQGDTLCAIARKYKPNNISENQYVDILININGKENVKEIELEQVILLPKM